MPNTGALFFFDHAKGQHFGLQQCFTIQPNRGTVKLRSNLLNGKPKEANDPTVKASHQRV